MDRNSLFLRQFPRSLHLLSNCRENQLEAETINTIKSVKAASKLVLSFPSQKCFRDKPSNKSRSYNSTELTNQFLLYNYQKHFFLYLRNHHSICLRVALCSAWIHCFAHDDALRVFVSYFLQRLGKSVQKIIHRLRFHSNRDSFEYESCPYLKLPRAGSLELQEETWGAIEKS